MKLIDQIVEVAAEHKKQMHVSDIASEVSKKYGNPYESMEAMIGRVGSTLAANVKKKRGEALFSKVKNKSGGFKRGIYKLKIARRSISKSVKVPEQPRVTTQFTGKAGEYSVMSELLFFGFNASSMTVDDGIDIVASKDNAYFHIQVKTANATAQGKYHFKITHRAFELKYTSATFYILVMRVIENNRNTCDHLVIPSGEIRRLIDKAVISEGANMSITIERERGGRFSLNTVEDISWALNRYDTIK